MSGDCCECVMTLTLRLTLTMSLTSREHQQVTRTGVTRGGGDRRHNYDREPGTGSGSSRDNRLELQRGNSIIGIVLPKCHASAQAPSTLACVCDHDWFGNIYSQKTWLIAFCPASTTTPILPFRWIFNPIISMDDWSPQLRATSSWLNLKILTIFQRENECKEAKVPNGPIELFWIRDLIKFKHVVHFSLD